MRRQSVYVLGIAGVILLCIYFLPKGWGVVSGEDRQFAEGTRIAGVEVSGYSKKEAQEWLVRKISMWKEEQPIQLQTKDKIIVIGESFLTFNIQETIDQVVESSNNRVVAEVDPSYEAMIRKELPYEVSKAFNWKSWVEKVEQHASMLTSSNQPYYIYNFLNVDNSDLYETVTSYSINPVPSSLKKQIRSIGEVKLSPSESFSLLNTLEEKAVTLNNHELSMMATALYGAILPTNFTVEERHIHRRLPIYAEVGKEASVVKEDQDDLIIHNPNSSPYTLRFSLKGDVLTARLIGYPFQYDYRIQVTELANIPSRTIVQFTTFLDPGEMKVESQGEAGVKVQVSRTSALADDPEIVSVDYYPPVHRVEWHYGSEDEMDDEVPLQEETEEVSEERDIAPPVTQEDEIWEQGHAVK